GSVLPPPEAGAPLDLSASRRGVPRRPSADTRASHLPTAYLRQPCLPAPPPPQTAQASAGLGPPAPRPPRHPVSGQSPGNRSPAEEPHARRRRPHDPPRHPPADRPPAPQASPEPFPPD